MDVTPLVQVLIAAAAAAVLAPALYAAMNMLTSSPSRFRSVQRLSGGWLNVWRGEVSAHTGAGLDSRVECGLTVEQRVGPDGKRYSVFLRQGKVSRDTIVSLYK